MTALDGRLQRLLSTILDELIDCEHHGLTGVRLHFIALKRTAIAIDLQVDFARLTANLFVVRLLNPAQPQFICIDKSQHVSRQRIVRIVTLRLFARINTVEIQRIEFARALDLQPAHYPDELLVSVLRVVETLNQIGAIETSYLCNLARGFVDILNFTGIAVEGFGIKTASQF